VLHATEKLRIPQPAFDAAAERVETTLRPLQAPPQKIIMPDQQSSGPAGYAVWIQIATMPAKCRRIIPRPLSPKPPTTGHHECGQWGGGGGRVWALDMTDERILMFRNAGMMLSMLWLSPRMTAIRLDPTPGGDKVLTNVG